MISTQFTIKLFAAFAISQGKYSHTSSDLSTDQIVVSAAPSSSVGDIAARGDPATNQSLALDGYAHIADLEACTFFLCIAPVEFVLIGQLEISPSPKKTKVGWSLPRV
jgi:hypothetical protein